MAYPLNSNDKWIDALRAPHRAVPRHSGGVWEYDVRLHPVRHSFHSNMHRIPMWAYGGGVPGDIIEAEVDTPLRVTWHNDLHDEQLSSLIEFGTRQGMEEDHMLATPHNQIHLHGARVPWTSDGSPMHVFHPHEARSYYYPNRQAAACLWYHDHAMDVTRLNVYAGLYGMYLLRDPAEVALLPSGDLEIPLVLQDKSFNAAGTKLRYEQAFDTSVSPAEATPEFIGQYPVVNGQIWPHLDLRPRVHRLRIVNGANTRFFNLSLTADSAANVNVPMYVIGSDGGFVPNAVPVTELLLAPGERADVLLDLRAMNGRQLIARNDAPIPYSGNPNDSHYESADYPPLDPADNCAELFQIRVVGSTDPDDARFDPATIVLPARRDPLPGSITPDRGTFAAIDTAIDAVPIDDRERDMTVGGLSFKLRRFTLEEYQLKMPTLAGVRIPNHHDGGMLTLTNARVPSVLINGRSAANASPVVTTQNAFEIWEFVNLTPDTHPMHVHLVQLQVISRTWVEVADDPARKSTRLPEPKKAERYLPPRLPIAAFEQGMKDTVRCDPGQATRLLMRFDGYAGEYVYHCHILEHEDMGMMFPIVVEPAAP